VQGGCEASRIAARLIWWPQSPSRNSGSRGRRGGTRVGFDLFSLAEMTLTQEMLTSFEEPIAVEE